MQNFRNLTVWAKAHALTRAIYRNTRSFPSGEAFGLTRQVRRAAVSIPANIAEGCGRSSRAEYAHFLEIAMGSASEVEYEVLLAEDLGFLTKAAHATLDAQITEVKRMLAAMIRRLRVSL